jgi:hypothetical protein
MTKVAFPYAEPVMTKVAFVLKTQRPKRRKYRKKDEPGSSSFSFGWLKESEPIALPSLAQGWDPA